MRPVPLVAAFTTAALFPRAVDGTTAPSFPHVDRGCGASEEVTPVVAAVRTLPGWLTPAEAVELSTGPLSVEVLSSAGDAAKAPGRTASLYLRDPHHRDNSLLDRLARRAAATAGVSLAAVEPAVLTRYAKNQRYGLHHDAAAVNRTHTLIVYLATLPKGAGGETVFAPAVADFDALCAEGNEGNAAHVATVRVRPERGLAVLWANLLPDGRPDSAAVHGSCPVVGDEHKWILQFWFSAVPAGFWTDDDSSHDDK